MRWKTLLDKAGDCLKGGSVTLYNTDTVTVRRRIWAQGASDKWLRYEQESLVNSRWVTVNGKARSIVMQEELKGY